jgi:hypothetical protein
MKRAITVVAVLVAPLLLGPLGPLGAGPAGAAQPRIYHTIGSTSASASTTTMQGCELTEVFASSSTAMYAAQPGPVNKQGLTSVLVRVSDTCAQSPMDVHAAAGGGGGGVVLFEAEAQSGAPLVVDPRLTHASVTSDLPGTDSQGNPVTVHLVATWTGTGPLEHTTVVNSNHDADGNVSATDNNLRRDASAELSVMVGDRSAAGPATDGVIEQTRSRCVEVPKPGVEGFFPCFGFPG